MGADATCLGLYSRNWHVEGRVREGVSRIDGGNGFDLSGPYHWDLPVTLHVLVRSCAAKLVTIASRDHQRQRQRKQDLFFYRWARNMFVLCRSHEGF